MSLWLRYESLAPVIGKCEGLLMRSKIGVRRNHPCPIRVHTILPLSVLIRDFGALCMTFIVCTMTLGRSLCYP